MLSAKQVEPGQQGRIEVEIKTENSASTLNKTVTVYSNDPRRPQVVLTITAEVAPEFEISPRSLYFGSAPKGTTPSREFTVSLNPGNDVRVLSAESTDESVSVRLSLVPDSNRTYKVVASQKPDAQEGYHRGFIVLKTTSAINPEIRIAVRGIVGPAGD